MKRPFCPYQKLCISTLHFCVEGGKAGAWGNPDSPQRRAFEGCECHVCNHVPWWDDLDLWVKWVINWPWQCLRWVETVVRAVWVLRKWHGLRPGKADRSRRIEREGARQGAGKAGKGWQEQLINVLPKSLHYDRCVHDWLLFLCAFETKHMQRWYRVTSYLKISHCISSHNCETV